MNTDTEKYGVFYVWRIIIKVKYNFYLETLEIKHCYINPVYYLFWENTALLQFSICPLGVATVPQTSERDTTICKYFIYIVIFYILIYWHLLENIPISFITKNESIGAKLLSISFAFCFSFS